MLAVTAAAVIALGQLQKVPPRPGYLLFLPKNVWTSKKRWPLILYLHGKSLRGNNLDAVARYGLPKRLKKDKGFPFIVVCPQLPVGRWTDTAALARLVKDVTRAYPVDPRRVYAMGYSMGASGVWRVAHAHPHLFAGLVSVAGSYELPLASSGRMKGLPVWMLHGTADKDAPIAQAKTVFLAHRGSGGRGRFTELPGKGHDVPGVFDRSDLYHWLQSHRQRPE